jgi:hypothetical protein
VPEATELDIERLELQARRDIPIPLIVAGRTLGWIGFGFWFGGLALAVTVIPAVASAGLQFSPLLQRHGSWHERMVGYLQTRAFDMVNDASIVCAILLIEAALLEARLWTGARLLGYLPLGLVCVSTAISLTSIYARWTFSSATSSQFHNLLGYYTDGQYAQLVLLVILACVMTAFQTLDRCQPEEARTTP